MSETRSRAAAGAKSGDTFTARRTFTGEETAEFGRLTRDHNPVHDHAGFAVEHGFRSPVLHGLLTAGLLCEIGGQIGWLATRMDFRFLRPVYAGDTITCRLTITEIDARGRAVGEAVYTNEAGEEVLTAVLVGRLPNQPQRRVLSGLVASQRGAETQEDA